MGMQAIRSSRAVSVLTWVLAFVGLYLVSLYSYLLFHSIAELFSIIIAFALFIIFWNARRIVRNSYFLFLGISYLFVAVLDLVHTLAYPGMNVIQGSDANLAAQLWIAARYLQSISLLIAPLFLGTRLRGIRVALGYALGVALLLGVILYWGIFPVCFVEGEGLTPFKVISEYIISLILVASLAALYRRRREFEAHVLQLLMASVIVAIASELAFTQYAHAYAQANLIGHLLKIVSFYLIYKAVVVTGLVRPYDLLFRDLEREREALVESEGKFRGLAEQSPNMIFIHVNGRVVYANEMCEELTGYTVEELYSPEFDFLTLMAPDSGRAIAANFTKHVAREDVPPIEYSLVTKEGKTMEALLATRLTSYEGEPAILGVVTDITERKRAAEALVESEERYRSLFEVLPVGVRLATVDGQVLATNSAMRRMMGYSEAELQDIGLPGTYLDPQDRAELVKKVERDGSVRQFEATLTRKDGTAFDASLTATPSIVGGREVILTVVRDVTERKLAEKDLVEAKDAAEAAQRASEERRREAERRREIAESLADVMNVLNSNETLDEVLDYITTQAGRLLENQAVAIYKLEQDGKLSVRAAQGLLLTYVVGQEIPIGQQALEQAMATGKAVAIPDLGTLLIGEDRPPRDPKSEAFARTWADLYQAMLAVPITVRDQPYGGIALYYVEPREFPEEEVELATVFGQQVALAIENARLRDQVQEAATIAERERLAGDLHDAVTQTLFSAGLIAETLPRIWERDPERAREGLGELRELTQGALAEMRTLLLELRPAALTEKPLGDLLRHLATAVTSRSRVPVRLTVEGDSSLPPETQIGLYRIAQEALNNMTKHATASEAFVDLRCEPGRARLSIRDDGRGFDAADVMPTHLGLGIMRERAERIGATINIRSQVGQGTLVTVDWQEMEVRPSHE